MSTVMAINMVDLSNQGRPEKQQSLAESANLHNIELLECALDIINPDIQTHSGKISMSLDITTELDDHEFAGIFETSLRGVTNDESEEEIFTLKVKHQVSYSMDSAYKIDQGELDHFAQSSMMLHVWPYVREFVSHMISYTSLPNLTLPLMPVQVRPISKGVSTEG